MLVDEYDGFTGIAAGILEHLGDEYDKKACLGLGLNHPISEETPLSLKDYKIRISNTVQLWSSFNRHARVFTSLGVCEDIFALNPVAKSIPNLIQDVRQKNPLAENIFSLIGLYLDCVQEFTIYPTSIFLLLLVFPALYFKRIPGCCVGFNHSTLPISISQFPAA